MAPTSTIDSRMMPGNARQRHLAQNDELDDHDVQRRDGRGFRHREVPAVDAAEHDDRQRQIPARAQSRAQPRAPSASSTRNGRHDCASSSTP